MFSPFLSLSQNTERKTKEEAFILVPSFRTWLAGSVTSDLRWGRASCWQEHVAWGAAHLMVHKRQRWQVRDSQQGMWSWKFTYECMEIRILMVPFLTLAYLRIFWGQMHPYIPSVFTCTWRHLLFAQTPQLRCLLGKQQAKFPEPQRQGSSLLLPIKNRWSLILLFT